ncbi:MAG: tetraacyldisaccharide 4'-kinase [Candidatus Latescibacterota bacterium]|jgi:tetraacyldisaccharide 4'-kinase
MKLLRLLLFPFSLIYGFIMVLRNYFYDKGWFRSKRYNVPVICVGNLSVGGTGKSPMIEFIIETLQADYKVAALSRGYKRKTRGYLEASIGSTAKEVGDEPLQFKQNYPNVTVAVCEDRQTGIEKLQQKAEVILLDDAFQHRKVEASTNILLTTFDNLFIDDFMLPTGNLREPKGGFARADIIIVTKCPDHVPYASLQNVEFRLPILSHQKLYFSKIGYDSQIHGITESLPLHYLEGKLFTLVTGIANPKPLTDYLKSKGFSFEHKKFGDHHHFSTSEIEKLKQKEIILTTQKDFMRLQEPLGKFALYYIGIKTEILKEQEPFLKETIRKMVKFQLRS